jgi:hypothetical protein
VVFVLSTNKISVVYKKDPGFVLGNSTGRNDEMMACDTVNSPIAKR